MHEPPSGDRRLYKARGPDGEVAWVDHDELWRLQQEQAQELRRERVRRRRRMLLGLAALVAVALMLAFLRLRPGGEPPLADRAVEAPAEAAPEEPSGAPAPMPEGPAAGGPQAPSRPTGPVAAAVQGWADAWTRQDVVAYLESYGVGFEPAGGIAQPAWRSLRRRRLERPAWIRVEIEDLEIVRREDGRAEARFRQSYESPLYADVVGKRLELVEEEGAWRIVAERAEPL